MSDNGKLDCGRRRLIFATATVGGAGAVAAAVPFVSSMLPSERAKAAGAPVEVDISRLESGQMMIVEWQGKPVWIVRRTPAMLETLAQVTGEISDPESKASQQPDYCKNQQRSYEKRPEVLVMIGICTHLGCSPSAKFKAGAEEGMTADWKGGFLCPCHGSTFDFAGRVFKAKPAPTNLPIPPHRYLSEQRILIGEHPTEA
ncbi:MAG: ubiquinol-cytochrome c reductase iron-sulfur subunit [Zoogloeaceae bacterium]|jgi:ubiquinol-cytochrome c reductase iron-sulfur subunit|nr:ubiquinol-cytochrome c reductase iron-sulfur subunit [Zoogloeaceae bacterium]